MQTSQGIDTQNFKIDGYLYVHQAMRKDIANFEEAANRLGKLSEQDAAKLQKWFQFFWEMVEIHHTEEDNVFFKDLAARDSDFVPAMETLTRDHHEIHDIVTEVGKVLQSLQTINDPLDREAARNYLVQLIKKFRESLNDHLIREEAVVIPTVSKHFSAKEQLDMSNKTMKSMPRKHIALLVPWVGSGLTPEEQVVALKTLPLPLRVMYNLSWKKKYEKFTEVFRA